MGITWRSRFFGFSFNSSRMEPTKDIATASNGRQWQGFDETEMLIFVKQPLMNVALAKHGLNPRRLGYASNAAEFIVICDRHSRMMYTLPAFHGKPFLMSQWSQVKPVDFIPDDIENEDPWGACCVFIGMKIPDFGGREINDYDICTSTGNYCAHYYSYSTSCLCSLSWPHKTPGFTGAIATCDQFFNGLEGETNGKS